MRLLIASSSSGLSNRIHCLAGCMLIAQHLDRHLYLDWPVNGELNRPFNYLFSNPLNVMDANIWDQLVYRTEINVKVYNHNESQGVLYDDRHEVLWLKSWYRTHFHDIDRAEFGPKYVKMIQSLRPQNRWQEEANKVELPPTIYGCHIRIGDRYRENGVFYCTDLYKDSTPEAFIRDMKAILEQEPEAHFYVATEIPDVMDQVIKSFDPGRIIPWPEKKWIHRTHEEGMEQAMVEMLILGRCQAVLGSEYSQYSELAAEFSNIPIWMVSQHFPINLSSWKRKFGPIFWPFNRE